jgi:hypothetical protein
MRAAILNHHWEGPLSDNERWFFEEAPALHWLVTGDPGMRFENSQYK